ncbi:MAG: hypothetical protein HQL24_03555 [Candidatus Omnitrophica bacterium]|nr:hypothetical protein [Candidatus Omnitrophota bacterium]
MTFQKKNSRYNRVGKAIHVVLIISFALNFSILPQLSYAQAIPTAVIQPIGLTPAFNPAVIKGIKIYPDNPLKFDFIVDVAQSGLKGDAFKDESSRLIKYFLASLTTPEDDMWVNLNPKEPDRIVPLKFGETEMGRDLLAQDYLLKQITSSLMNPEKETGKQFWDKIYKKAYQMYGSTDVPVDTLNKVWIIPDKAVVYENPTKDASQASAFVVEAKLKVMLEEDYFALSQKPSAIAPKPKTNTQTMATAIIKEVIIPELEKEVNFGKTFAPLRQIYYSMILATWFKQSLKESILGKVYVDQNKTNGVEIKDKQEKLKIYNRYLEAFKKGAYNYIKEEYDPVTQSLIPRKYFSGGAKFKFTEKSLSVTRDKTMARRTFLAKAYFFSLVGVILGASGGVSTVFGQQSENPGGNEIMLQSSDPYTGPLTQLSNEYRNIISSGAFDRSTIEQVREIYNKIKAILDSIERSGREVPESYASQLRGPADFLENQAPRIVFNEISLEVAPIFTVINTESDAPGTLSSEHLATELQKLRDILKRLNDPVLKNSNVQEAANQLRSDVEGRIADLTEYLPKLKEHEKWTRTHGGQQSFNLPRLSKGNSVQYASLVPNQFIYIAGFGWTQYDAAMLTAPQIAFLITGVVVSLLTTSTSGSFSSNPLPPLQSQVEPYILNPNNSTADSLFNRTGELLGTAVKLIWDADDLIKWKIIDGGSDGDKQKLRDSLVIINNAINDITNNVLVIQNQLNAINLNGTAMTADALQQARDSITQHLAMIKDGLKIVNDEQTEIVKIIEKLSKSLDPSAAQTLEAVKQVVLSINKTLPIYQLLTQYAQTDLQDALKKKPQNLEAIAHAQFILKRNGNILKILNEWLNTLRNFNVKTDNIIQINAKYQQQLEKATFEMDKAMIADHEELNVPLTGVNSDAFVTLNPFTQTRTEELTAGKAPLAPPQVVKLTAPQKGLQRNYQMSFIPRYTGRTMELNLADAAMTTVIIKLSSMVALGALMASLYGASQDSANNGFVIQPTIAENGNALVMFTFDDENIFNSTLGLLHAGILRVEDGYKFIDSSKFLEGDGSEKDKEIVRDSLAIIKTNVAQIKAEIGPIQKKLKDIALARQTKKSQYVIINNLDLVAAEERVLEELAQIQKVLDVIKTAEDDMSAAIERINAQTGMIVSTGGDTVVLMTYERNLKNYQDQFDTLVRKAANVQTSIWAYEQMIELGGKKKAKNIELLSEEQKKMEDLVNQRNLLLKKLGALNEAVQSSFDILDKETKASPEIKAGYEKRQGRLINIINAIFHLGEQVAAAPDLRGYAGEDVAFEQAPAGPKYLPHDASGYFEKIVNFMENELMAGKITIAQLQAYANSKGIDESYMAKYVLIRRALKAQFDVIPGANGLTWEEVSNWVGWKGHNIQEGEFATMMRALDEEFNDGTGGIRLNDVDKSKYNLTWNKKDRAMSTSDERTNGGIDLNSKNLTIEKKGSPIKFNPKMSLESLKNVSGFTPVIINVAPIANVFQLLGLADPSQDEKPSS